MSSTSAIPTYVNIDVTPELLTDKFLEDISWSLVDNSQDDVIVYSGPGDGETCDVDSESIHFLHLCDF